MLVIAALVVLTIGVAVLLVRFRQDQVVEAYRRFAFWRQFIGTILFALVAWTFLRSGRPALILIALVLVFFVTLYVLVDKPNETLT